MTDPPADGDQKASAAKPTAEPTSDAAPDAVREAEADSTEESSANSAPEVRPELQPNEVPQVPSEPDAVPRVPPESRDPCRAPFLDELPEAPELEPLIAAFAAGNYARVRQLARSLEGPSTAVEVRDAARELVRRTEPDRVVVVLFVLAFALFIFVAAWSILGHAH